MTYKPCATPECKGQYVSSARGLCRACRRKADRHLYYDYDRQYALDNRVKMSAYANNYYQQRKVTGGCHRCKSRPPRDGFTTCQTCADGVSATQSRRRAAGGGFTAAAWEHLKALFGHCCAYCRRKMKKLTQDHVIPISKGGWHCSMNIVPACQPCNARKGASV